MIDVITIIDKRTPRVWITDCIQSINRAKDRCGSIRNTIQTPGVEGHVGQAISNGLKKAKAEYVCFVDDDDLVLPNAFTCLEPYLEKRLAAVFAREFHLLANGRIIMANRRHHLSLYRRDVLESIDFTSLPVNTAPAMIREAESAGPVEDEFSWVYLYRVYKSKAMEIRRDIQIKKS